MNEVGWLYMAHDTHHSHFGLIDTQEIMMSAERIKASESHFFLIWFLLYVCIFPACMELYYM